jgi:hypothetical protein
VIAQPLAFRLVTSIISKITLKRIQLTANLYEIASIPLEVELPIEFTEATEFYISIQEECS